MTFPETDLKPYLEALRADVQALAAATKTEAIWIDSDGRVTSEAPER